MGACDTVLSIEVLDGFDALLVSCKNLLAVSLQYGLLYSIPLMAEVLKLLKQQG